MSNDKIIGKSDTQSPHYEAYHEDFMNWFDTLQEMADYLMFLDKEDITHVKVGAPYSLSAFHNVPCNEEFLEGHLPMARKVVNQ
jgi:hypothetical protein